MLSRRKEGRVHHCRLEAEKMKAAQQWIAAQRALWNDRLDRLESYLKENPK